jgi:hypothetical protein
MEVGKVRKQGNKKVVTVPINSNFKIGETIGLIELKLQPKIDNQKIDSLNTLNEGKDTPK